MSEPRATFTLPDLRSFTPSIVRTLVPLLVGYFSAWPVANALGLDGENITSLVTVLTTFVYYLLVRVLELHVLPAAGWLLGYASPPVYVAPSAVTSQSPARDVVGVVEENQRSLR